MKLGVYISLLFLLLGFMNLKSQTHYVCENNKLYTLNASSCGVNLVCNSFPVTINSNTNTGPLTDVAFGSNGNLYAMTSQHLIELDTNNCIGNHIISFNSSPTSLVGAVNGKMYAASDTLYEIDLTIPSITVLGALPCTSAGDLAFFNGNLYMTCQSGDLLQVDINVPANSIVLGNLGINGNWFGMWTDFSGCNNSQIYITNEDDVYTLNLSPLSTTFQCSLGWSQWVWLGGATTQDDYLASGCNISPSNLVASFNPSALTICEGDSITFTDNSTGNNISAWSWTFNGGTPASSNTQGPHTIGFNTSGNYNIVLQVTDSSGTDDTTIAIVVLPRASSNVNSAICSGDSILLGGSYQTVAGIYNDTIINGAANGCDSVIITTLTINPSDTAAFTFPSVSYCLSDPNPTPNITGTMAGVFTIDNSGVINGTSGEIDLNASGMGTYVVTYITNGTCPDTATFTINIVNFYDATITPAGSFCSADAAINLTSVDGGGTWSGTGITNAGTGTFDPSVAGAGTHQIIYTISGSCGDIDTITIIVSSSPNISLTQTDDNCFRSEGIIMSLVNGGISPYSYLWNNGGITPSISNLPAGTYNLIVTDSLGCTNSAIGVVNDLNNNCNYHIFLPNIFSPNGDNHNDIFKVRGEGIKALSFVVYSRWGEKVFETNDPEIGWNGDYKGEEMNAGVFVYYLKATMINNELIEKQGNVTLVR
jgi:gliding motility-associated-like protein